MSARNIKKAAAAILLALGSILSVRYALGFRNFVAFQEARSGARSIESGFQVLEPRLVSAVRWYPSPSFIGALAGLYLDMAAAANAYGTEAKREERDKYLDQAEAVLKRLLRKTPVRAAAWYDLSRVYFLYNFPVLQYGAKARSCLQRAMELAPADEFITVNGLYLFLSQWELFGEKERMFVRAKMADVSKDNPEFLEAVRKRLKDTYGDTRKLDGVL